MIVAGNPRHLESIMRGLIKRKRNNPEEQLQKLVIQHLTARGMPGVLWWHVPNEALLGDPKDVKGRAIRGNRLKALGMKPGCSDLHFLYRGNFYALELKSGTNPTEEQMQFVSDVNSAMGFACIVDGIDQALKVLETWGLLRGEGWQSIGNAAARVVEKVRA